MSFSFPKLSQQVWTGGIRELPFTLAHVRNRLWYFTLLLEKQKVC